MKWELGFSPFNPLKSLKHTQRRGEGGRLVGDRLPLVVSGDGGRCEVMVERDKGRRDRAAKTGGRASEQKKIRGCSDFVIFFFYVIYLVI